MQVHDMNLESDFVKIFRSGSEAPLVVLNTFEGEGEKVYSAVKKITDITFSLALVSVPDWNRDMSLWPASGVFQRRDFEGGADKYLNELSSAVLPKIYSDLGGRPSKVYIAGYSMAGLFALYSIYAGDNFDGAASVSGSLWYPGFEEYAIGHDLSDKAKSIYISLGDKESATRNKVMATVEDTTRNIHEHYRSLGIDTVFEMNEGNHFKEPYLRTAKGIAWLIGRSRASN